jgi:hypothetical protein
MAFGWNTKHQVTLETPNTTPAGLRVSGWEYQVSHHMPHSVLGVLVSTSVCTPTTTSSSSSTSSMAGTGPGHVQEVSPAPQECMAPPPSTSSPIPIDSCLFNVRPLLRNHTNTNTIQMAD